MPVGRQTLLSPLVDACSRAMEPAVDQPTVQAQFDAITNKALGRPKDAGSAFPLLAEGELRPQNLKG